jgi:hypothetical protein
MSRHMVTMDEGERIADKASQRAKQHLAKLGFADPRASDDPKEKFDYNKCRKYDIEFFAFYEMFKKELVMQTKSDLAKAH